MKLIPYIILYCLVLGPCWILKGQIPSDSSGKCGTKSTPFEEAIKQPWYANPGYLDAKPISLARKLLPKTGYLVGWLILSTIIFFSCTTSKEKQDECHFSITHYIKNPDSGFPNIGPFLIALKCKNRADTSMFQNFRLDSIIELSTKYKLNTRSSPENLSSPFIAKKRDSICALIRFSGNLLGARGGKATIGDKYQMDTLLLYLSHSGGSLKTDTIIQRYIVSEAPNCVRNEGYPFYLFSLDWKRISDSQFMDNIHLNSVYYVGNN
jgi:hypothetical protein